MAEAREVVKIRRAEEIRIDSADQVFPELSESVESLSAFQHAHPESTAIAVETTKRYLPEARHRIRLHDLVERELEAVQDQLTSGNFEPQFPGTTNEEHLQEMHRRIQRYEAIVQRLNAVLATIAFHDQGDNVGLLTKCVERLCETPSNTGSTMLIDLQYYPALLATYSAGMAAMASSHMYNLYAILSKPRYYDLPNRKRLPSIDKLNINKVFSNPKQVTPIEDARNKHTPGSDYLYSILWPMLRELIPSEINFEESFDTFEYLLGLTYWDLTEGNRPDGWLPIGRFGWKYQHSRDGEFSPIRRLGNEAALEHEEWELLKVGFFSSSYSRFQEVEGAANKWIQTVTNSWI